MYIVLEIQTMQDGTVATLATTAATWREAQGVYHNKLWYAAQSTLPCYAVALLDSHGNLLESRYYTTDTEPEGEGE